VVSSIDGVELNGKMELARLLNDKAGEVVTLRLARGPAERRVELTPASRKTVSELMYDRWTERNARKVTELSKGRLGYVHIPKMDNDGLESFARSLLSDNFDKDGIILDVRFNGGGFTHESVLNYLGGKEHAYFYQRQGGKGTALNRGDRKWTRPLALLINNRSFSDAEIFPNAFRAYGLGKLVGQPTGGMVIGTRSTTLIDGSTFRLPRTGVFTSKGVNMDKEGVIPDVLVEAHPDDLARGEDAQLARAVAVLLGDLAAGAKK
jgi:tricorn protease